MKDLKMFLEDVKQDDMAREFGDFLTGRKPETEDDILKGMAEFATGKGYAVTLEELKAETGKSRMLSDDELENVAGGLNIDIRAILEEISQWINKAFCHNKINYKG